LFKALTDAGLDTCFANGIAHLPKQDPRLTGQANREEFVKSPKTHYYCHSGLSGIFLFQGVIKTADSGQAGMTTFYETVNSQCS
jgi:hypothetical protein